MTTFSERLKYAMGEAQMNQADLSLKTGIGKPSISQYLSGKNEPKRDKIDRMAGALGCSADFLLGYEHTGTEDQPATSEKVTIKDAAQHMGKSEQFVRVGLQRGTLPFGWAVKTSSRWSYFISPIKFREYIQIYTGLDLDENYPLKSNFQNDNTISVDYAAQLMRKPPQFIRLGLQQKTLPIGAAVRLEDGRWDYYISPKLFKEFTGIDVQE